MAKTPVHLLDHLLMCVSVDSVGAVVIENPHFRVWNVPSGHWCYALKSDGQQSDLSESLADCLVTAYNLNKAKYAP